MITPCTPTRLVRLGLAVSVLVALVVAWAQTGNDVPEDSPEREDHELLELIQAQVLARDHIREALVDELAAGRAPLREAARAFADFLEREHPIKMINLRSGRQCAELHPGASLEERCARWLVRRLQLREHSDSWPEAALRLDRLERELAEAYGTSPPPGDIPLLSSPQ